MSRLGLTAFRPSCRDAGVLERICGDAQKHQQLFRDTSIRFRLRSLEESDIEVIENDYRRVESTAGGRA